MSAPTPDTYQKCIRASALQIKGKVLIIANNLLEKRKDT